MPKPLGTQQEYLLSEIYNNGGWVEVGSTVCGSNYGGQKKHETMVKSLKDRHLVVTKSENQKLWVKALPTAIDFV